MENSNNPLLKSTMTSGAILGIALIVYNVILYVFNANLNPGLASISYIFIIIGIVYGTKNYRDEFNNGYISYARALGVGTLVAVFAGVLNSLYQYIYVTYIDLEYFDNLVDLMVQSYQEMGMDDDQIEKLIEASNYTRTPLFFTFSAIFGSAIIGFIISLITSFFLKKENDSFEDAMENVE